MSAGHVHEWQIQVIGDEPVGITCECGDTRPVVAYDPEREDVKKASEDWFKSITDPKWYPKPYYTTPIGNPITYTTNDTGHATIPPRITASRIWSSTYTAS